MAKIKIEIEIDVDFQKHFDDIPESLYKNGDDRKVDDDYISASIHDVLNDSHTHQIVNAQNWMLDSHKKGDNNYKFTKHHLDISTEVAKQMFMNVKVKIIK